MNQRQGDLFPLIETKELRKTATADRNAVAAHPDLQALVMELELLGFSPFAIAEGLSLKANKVRQRGQNQLIGVRCRNDEQRIAIRTVLFRRFGRPTRSRALRRSLG